jgi:hypothetical protein
MKALRSNDNINVLNNKKGFTQEALAGLAAIEDYTSVKLKRSDSNNVGEYAPYNDLMLIQIKGLFFETS